MIRRTVIFGVAAAAVAATLTSGPGAGAASPAFPHGAKRVCAVPAGHVAACSARVVTNAKTGKPAASISYSSGYSPAQLRGVYPPGSSTALVAVIDAYAHPTAVSDLNAYRSQFGMAAANFTQVNQNGQSAPLAGANVGWGQEEMLDLEMVSAMCPNCPILYVGANSASFNDLAAAVRTAKNLGAKVISNSYGAAEFRGETAFESSYNIPGVAVTVSSGDSGYGAQYPASAHDVVAVGGTTLRLTSTGARASETVWSGAGSGCSAYIAKPLWQTQQGCSRRMEADISAVADPATGVAVYDTFGSTGGANWYVFGGTSVAAPLVGALYATYGVPATGSVAQLAWAHPDALFDVTSGSNGRCTKGFGKSPAYFCTGGIGYDGPSGNGTPKGDGRAF